MGARLAACNDQKPMLYSHKCVLGGSCIGMARTQLLSIAGLGRTIRAQICTPCHALSESETDSTDCSPTSVAA
jgi:hypothetical protein